MTFWVTTLFPLNHRITGALVPRINFTVREVKPFGRWELLDNAARLSPLHMPPMRVHIHVQCERQTTTIKSQSLLRCSYRKNLCRLCIIVDSVNEMPTDSAIKSRDRIILPWNDSAQWNSARIIRGFIFRGFLLSNGAIANRQYTFWWSPGDASLSACDITFMILNPPMLLYNIKFSCYKSRRAQK